MGALTNHRPAEGIATRLPLRGEVDVASVPALEARLTRLLADGARFVDVDVTELRFIDCSGLGALAATSTALRKRGGRLRLVGASARLRTVVDLVRLSDLLD